jgi:hypothetical protein
MAANCGYGDAPAGRKLLEYHGPTIEVAIGLDPTWTDDQPRQPKADRTNLTALIDTGALESCIDSALATALGLPIVNRRTLEGVASIEVDVYRAQVHVGQLRYTIHGAFAAIPDMQRRLRVPVILGRTFLRVCKLTYEGKTGAAGLDLTL